MSPLDEAKKVIRDAELELRNIIALGVNGGNYQLISPVLEWAKVLNHLTAGTSEPAVSPVQTIEGSTFIEKENPTEISKKTTRKGKQRGSKKSKKKQKTVSEYPKFLREGDFLVKIGWSKRESKPYEHKAPRTVLLDLIKRLAQIGQAGERFTVDSILPLRGIDNCEIPDYQIYLSLAWLRSVDLIVQHGRQGYSVVDASQLGPKSELKWNELTKR